MIKNLLIAILAAAAFTFAADPVTIEGRLTEIPGKMPSNDLYSYVYVFKYKVLKVVSGKLDAKEVLVGVYNPLIARGKVKDKTWASSRRRPSTRSRLCRSRATGTAPWKTSILTTKPRATWRLK